eukprot:SAG11_NODE_3889_length_2165_cov_0.903679_2_plen_192_part_00
MLTTVSRNESYAAAATGKYDHVRLYQVGWVPGKFRQRPVARHRLIGATGRHRPPATGAPPARHRLTATGYWLLCAGGGWVARARRGSCHRNQTTRRATHSRAGSFREAASTTGPALDRPALCSASQRCAGMVCRGTLNIPLSSRLASCLHQFSSQLPSKLGCALAGTSARAWRTRWWRRPRSQAWSRSRSG